jgi:hypothetical protein
MKKSAPGCIRRPAPILNLLQHSYPSEIMSQNKPFTIAGHSDAPAPTEVRLKQTPGFRESYANSVQVRMSVWDFQLTFGTMQQVSPTEVDLNNFQAIYLSPQQAKALWNILSHNLAQYEQTFGKLNYEPVPPAPGSPVN